MQINVKRECVYWMEEKSGSYNFTKKKNRRTRNTETASLYLLNQVYRLLCIYIFCFKKNEWIIYIRVPPTSVVNYAYTEMSLWHSSIILLASVCANICRHKLTPHYIMSRDTIMNSEVRTIRYISKSCLLACLFE